MFDRIMRKLRDDDDKERKIYEERAKRKNIHDNDEIPKMNENKKNEELEYNEKKQLKEGKKEKEDTLELRLSTFEIYEKMISQQIKKRLGELLPDKSRMKQSIVLMRQEFGGIFGEEEEGDNLYDQREEEEMEYVFRVGELVALEMIKENKNRISFLRIYEKLEELKRNMSVVDVVEEEEKEQKKMDHNNKYKKNDINSAVITGRITASTRIEWSNLYNILIALDMKMEEQKKRGPDNNNNNNEIESEMMILVGFRHDTYKNFYLLRGLERELIKKLGARESRKKLEEELMIIKETQKGLWKTNQEKNENYNDDNKKKDDVLLNEHLDEKRGEVELSFIDSVLGRKENLFNYELIKFIGEEIRFNKKKKIRDALIRLLEQQQFYNRVKRLENISGKKITKKGIFFKNEKQNENKVKYDNQNEKKDKIKKENLQGGQNDQGNNKKKNLGFGVEEGHESLIIESENSVAAMIISILVSARYTFKGKDLSDLDFTNAFMRGGYFFDCKFENTCLKNANLRHSKLDGSSFENCNFQDVDLGLKPDLIGHSDYVTSVSFSS